MISRRLLLGAPLVAAAPAWGVTSDIRLQPGAPRLGVRARIEPHPTAREALAIAFAGPGAPESRVLLPSWYGRARVLQALPIARREVLLAAFEGNRGTGIFQELLAVIGADDGGRLRVLGIETLSFRDQQSGMGWRRMTGRLEAEPGRDALRLSMSSIARLPRTPPGPQPGPEERENWTTRLIWGGEDPLRPAVPARRSASALRRRVDVARAQVSALLTEPVTDVTTLDLDATGLWAVGYASPEDR